MLAEERARQGLRPALHDADEPREHEELGGGPHAPAEERDHGVHGEPAEDRGRLARRREAAILGGLAVYAVIALLGWRMRTTAEFFVLAGLVGVVQGGTQALSRSLFASMIPPHRSGELFGYWGVFEKFAGVLGPLTFDLVIGATGSSRSAVLAVIAFFAVGAALLATVDVEAGRRTAAAEAAAAHAPGADGA